MNWRRPELRVLFVCTANVCRSPLAEGLLRHRLGSMGLANRVKVHSAGSSAAQRGRRPDPRVEKLAAEAGVSLGRIRSRPLTLQMIRHSDYVLVMEHRHLEDIKRLCTDPSVAGETSQEKQFSDTLSPDRILLLGSFLPLRDGHVNDIPDPYFGDWQAFSMVYGLIDSALNGFLARIETQLGNSRHSRP